MTLRLAFLGTFHPAVPTLRRLAERGWVAVVVMPRSGGPKNDELLSVAEEFSLPWSYELKDIDSHDPNLLLAANYPKLVPERYLEAIPCLNTHWSLLPRYRGVHPTAWALINGDQEIGLTVHKMEREFDTGEILAQRSVRVRHDMLITELHSHLAHLQADAVDEVLSTYLASGKLAGSAQDETVATYVPTRVPDDGIIHWSWPTSRIDALVRALPPPVYPGAFTHLFDRRLLIVDAAPAPTPSYFATPGQVVRRSADGSVWVKTGDGCLIVRNVQWADEADPLPAASVLKRGARLGYDVQLEISSLRQEVAELREIVRTLRVGHISAQGG